MNSIHSEDNYCSAPPAWAVALDKAEPNEGPIRELIGELLDKQKADHAELSRLTDKINNEMVYNKAIELEKAERALTESRKECATLKEALEKADQIIKGFTGDGKSHIVIERALTQLDTARR